MQHTFRLKSTDSRYATKEELNAAGITPDQIPLDWKIMAHQAATVRALRYSDVPIIVNQAMTGDGKSLAGQFMLFNERWQTFAMYPTKELASDQERNVEELLSKWTPPRWSKGDLVRTIINANTLDENQQALGNMKRAKTLEILLDSSLALTNPDIFHLAMQFDYTSYGTVRDIVPTILAERYNLFVFDEFHLFGAAQTASVMIAGLLMIEILRNKKLPRFLFLSATPQEALLHLASKANLRIETIDGDYQHGMPMPPDGFRRIMQPSTITLYDDGLETWVESHLYDVIMRFFEENRPGAKGVIIANSVATAHRVYRVLEVPCQQAGIQLGINTGLTPITERGRDVDLLVATSTIDVGVDFRINLIIFESTDAASHMQRLGRLGRHEIDAQKNKFHTFEAHALLPSWVVEGMIAEFPAGSEVCRPDYQKTLRKVFPPLQQFDDYIKKWAGIQAAHVLNELRQPEIRKQYEETVSRLKPIYQSLFPGCIKKYITLLEDDHAEVLHAARSFRGSSPFTALVLDVSNNRREVVTYNLITLLLHAELDAVEMKELLHKVGQNAVLLERSSPLAAYKLLGWLPKPRPLNIYLDRTLDEDQYDVVTQQSGFRLVAPGVPELSKLNDRLEALTLAVRLVRYQEPKMLGRRLRLGYQLELFKFSTADMVEGTVAFGRDALLLDSVLYRASRSTGGHPFLL